MDYFTDNKKVVIKTEDGKYFESKSSDKTPDKEKDRKLREGEITGKVKFSDKARFSEQEEEITITEVRLVYDGELVALRKIMPITMCEQDTLEITYEFSMSRRTDSKVGRILEIFT